jgi:hypothetical protein
MVDGIDFSCWYGIWHAAAAVAAAVAAAAAAGSSKQQQAAGLKLAAAGPLKQK